MKNFIIKSILVLLLIILSAGVIVLYLQLKNVNTALTDAETKLAENQTNIDYWKDTIKLDFDNQDSLDKIELPKDAPKMFVFFEIGMDPAKITELREMWEKIEGVTSIVFTNEEAAYAEYLVSVESSEDEVLTDIVKNLEVKKLSSNFEFEFDSSDSGDFVENRLKTSIREELAKLDRSASQNAIKLVYE